MMNERENLEIEAILDRSVDGLFLLILDQHHRHVAELELTVAQAQALRLLRGGPVSTSKLALLLGISPPAVSQLTDRLVRKRLIERRVAERDRRSITVELSEKGRRVVEGFRVRRKAIFGDVLLRLAAEDRAEVIEALDRIGRVLQPGATGTGDEKPERARVRLQRARRRTAVPAPITSKIGEEVQTVAPKPKRMRIEWD
ncbi:MAG TPA: MarR family transcriptional regulator [Blastocatellia bacterium]|nr:MarR family transcriptional regulator [Blastocatellia bacterium]